MIQLKNCFLFLAGAFLSFCGTDYLICRIPVDISGISLIPGEPYYTSFLLSVMFMVFCLLCITCTAFFAGDERAEYLRCTDTLDCQVLTLLVSMISNAAAAAGIVIFQYFASDTVTADRIVRFVIASMSAGIVFLIWSVYFLIFIISRIDDQTGKQESLRT